MSTHQNAIGRRGGFTMVELLLVVVIVSILAGLAIPNYRNVVTKARAADLLGRSDVVEDRLFGIKSREFYEAPAATVLLMAHRDLESLVSGCHAQAVVRSRGLYAPLHRERGGRLAAVPLLQRRLHRLQLISIHPVSTPAALELRKARPL